MTQSLCLHYAPDNASLCVRLALEEQGLPYETMLVDRRQHAQRSPAYLAMNPNGLIPVLETHNGPMFETGAILLWLADTYGGLLPGTKDDGRHHAVQWMFWLANSLHPAQRMLFYPDQYTSHAPEALRRMTQERLRAHFTLLDHARDTDWIDKDAPSALACYLAPLLRWPALYGGNSDWFDLTQFPRLYRFARRFEQRPAPQRASLAEGLGPTPFSAPHPCNPPQGSAL